MKVLMINPRYRGGGADRCARELTSALGDAGVTVDMRVGPKDPTYPPNVVGLRFGWEKYLRAIAWLKIDVDWRHIGSRRELNRIQPGDFDIVHLHNLFGGGISLHSVQRLAERIPLVWTFHDEWPVTLMAPYDLSRVMPADEIDRRWGKLGGFHPQHPVAKRVVRFITPRLARPSAIICPSQWLAKLARDQGRYPGVPIHHVPNGMPFLDVPQTQQSRIEARDALGVPRDAKVILMVAAHLASAYKGTHLALQAFPKLKTENIHLLMAGITGQSGEELVQAIRLPLKQLGYVSSDATLAQMYRAADVTLLPSVADNLPYVALESMACETPVVAFALGGFPEIIGNDERGALARPLDTDDLARQIDRLLSDDLLRAACGARARQWTIETCNVPRWVDSHMRIYNQTIADFNARRVQTAERVA